MQKRSHKLLASALLRSHQGFRARRFELAFLFGSFQPDCNPLTYLRGSLHGPLLKGHNFSSSQPYINAHIQKLQQCSRWSIWQYYTLGKLTHYLADAFTFSHNDHFPLSLMNHHQYETHLRLSLKNYLSYQALHQQAAHTDLSVTIRQLHREYTDSQSNVHRDIHYITHVTGLLMSACLPCSVSL